MQYIKILLESLSLTVLMYLVIFALVRTQLVVEKPLAHPAVIVLLAGSYQDRIPVAATLFTRYRADKIVVTDDDVMRGWSRKYQRNLSSREKAYEGLTNSGVPGKSIELLPFSSSGTAYDARAVRDYLVNTSYKSILLVTSDYHTRRALWVFRQIFRNDPVEIGVIPVPSPFVSWSAIKEPLKYIYYLLYFF